MTLRSTLTSLAVVAFALGSSCKSADEATPAPEKTPDTSETGCKSDGDCEGELVCEVSSGQCLACLPNAGKCDGASLLLCEADGSGYGEPIACDDADPCTTGDGCEAGQCNTVEVTSCDDADACTADLCDGGTGECRHLPSGQPGCCEKDGDCDDGLDCTTDTCDATTGTCGNSGGPCSEEVTSWGEKGKADGQLDGPRGVAVSPKGLVIVADTGNDRVVVFDPAGAVVRTFGAKGSGDGELSQPGGVALLPDGRIAVADTGNARVAIFSFEGEWVGAIDGKAGEGSRLVSPTAVSPAVQGDGIWVVNNGKDQVLRLSLDDEVLGLEIGGKGSAEGHFREPRDVVQATSGTVWVTDNLNHRVQAFDPSTAEVLVAFGAEGSEPGQLVFPTGIAITDGGYIAVADSGNGRLQFFQMCAPSCDGRECGDNGCGGSCGECLGSMTCEEGKCAGGEQGGKGCEASETELKCDGCGCEECVCAADPYCCDPVAANDPGAHWDDVCVAECNELCGFLCEGKPTTTGEPQVKPTVSFSRELGAGTLASPVAIAVGEGGLLYVVDNVQAKVRVYRLTP